MNSFFFLSSLITYRIVFDLLLLLSLLLLLLLLFITIMFIFIIWEYWKKVSWLLKNNRIYWKVIALLSNHKIQRYELHYKILKQLLHYV